MRQYLRFVMASLLLLLLVASTSVTAPPVAALTAPPEPVRPTSSPGSWYAGGTPPNMDPAKPVLVFVHGKGGSASAWWIDTAYHGPNDMYAHAYTNGYRTAFVDLEPEGDMWANGELLRQQLAEITAHFGVEKVVVIAHSKGGVDSNAADVFFGAGPMIEKVITLATPHWGTPLADLAYSTWTWWLAALLGQQSDATYVMQTGYMAWFRSVADGAGDTVPYYTVSGRKCGPFLTALWWGCIYLAGEDDGVVPLGNGHKPGGTIVVDGWWDHDEIRMGSRSWGAISGLIQSSSSYRASARPAEGLADGRPGALTNILARGGEVTGTAEGQPFPLESGVRTVSFTIFASSPDFVATLDAPDGASYTVAAKERVPDGEVFGGAWVGSLELDRPAAGGWRFDASASGRTGYLMVAALDSDLRARLELGAVVVEPGARQALSVAFSRPVQGGSVTGALSVEGGAPYAQPAFTLATGGAFRATVILPRQQGVHNLTVTATGRLDDGTAFERTLVTSLAVVANGTRAPWTGRE